MEERVKKEFDPEIVALIEQNGTNIIYEEGNKKVSIKFSQGDQYELEKNLETGNLELFRVNGSKIDSLPWLSLDQFRPLENVEFDNLVEFIKEKTRYLADIGGLPREVLQASIKFNQIESKIRQGESFQGFIPELKEIKQIIETALANTRSKIEPDSESRPEPIPQAITEPDPQPKGEPLSFGALQAAFGSAAKAEKPRGKKKKKR